MSETQQLPRQGVLSQPTGFVRVTREMKGKEMNARSNEKLESLLRALEEIAEDQKTLMGHGDYIEGPMSGEDAQNIARRALEEIERLKGERDAMSYVAHAVVDQMERLAKEESGITLIAADPDLLEALKWVRLNYASGPTAEINARIDAALAKAGG